MKHEALHASTAQPESIGRIRAQTGLEHLAFNSASSLMRLPQA